MEDRKILVLGGTGKTGRRVVERLTRLGHKNVRIGSRSGEPFFDWENPETWTATINGRNAHVTNDIKKVLGRQAKDFTEYARETAMTGIWTPSNLNAQTT